MQTLSLICSACGRRHVVNASTWRCDCGGVLDLEFEPVIDKDAIRRGPPTLWRYREAIPLPHDARVITMGEGFTPLVPIEIDGRSVLIKQDQLFPTGSYKDRGASVLISLAASLGVSELIEDSSGNAGSAIAAYAALASIRARILVPESTSEGKLALIAATGARLDRIPGSREATALAARNAAESAFYASHCWNPTFLQGTKTFAYEVCEQLGWQAPDSVVLPVGNGSLLLGAAIGFAELRTAGITTGVPRIVAVQAAACDPLARAFADGSDTPVTSQPSKTMAEGIAIAEPTRGLQILKAVRVSGGRFLTVTEEEISEALADMAERGFCIEPTSAATMAGLRSYLRHGASPGESIVSVFTGRGRKSPDDLRNRLTKSGPI